MTSQLERVDHDRDRAMSGSAAIRRRKRVIAATRVEHRLVHVDVDQLGAGLDLLAGDLDGLVVAVLEDEPGELARAGHVRPLADVDEDVARLRDDERLRGRTGGSAGRRPGIARGGRPATAAAIARTWAGVVPQQPPAMLTSPSRGELAEQRRPSSRASRRSRRTRSAGRRSGRPRPAASAIRARSATCPRSCAGAERAVEPDDQRPGVARSTCQNASTVWPESVRPDASMIVPGDDEREPLAGRVERRLDAEDRRLGVERVEDRLDERGGPRRPRSGPRPPPRRRLGQLVRA